MKDALAALAKESSQNIKKIVDLAGKIEKLESRNDSMQIYKEAFEIASINTDDASERILTYLRQLDNGISIQEAREIVFFTIIAH